jgi:2-polyprenyl-3-methyl-5-hydroxy-6-metoxy-1,4-benzoquinol methylase
MRLNRFERLLMENPVRRFSQRWIEAEWMRQHLPDDASGGRMLEIGCGDGTGIELAFDDLGADVVHAFDVDPSSVARAYRRTLGRNVRLWCGTVEAIPADTGEYDAVLDFGVLHHVEDWQRGVDEIARVLRPGGRLLAEEMLARFVTHPASRALFDHPQANRFDLATLSEQLRGAGLRIVDAGDVAGLVGWICAERTSDRVTR